MNNYISNLFTKILVLWVKLKYNVTEYLSNPKNMQLILTVGMILIGTVGLHFCMLFLPAFSAYPAIIGNIGFALFLWKAIDIYFLPDFDLIFEIKKGNIAAALYFLCYCALIVASIVTT